MYSVGFSSYIDCIDKELVIGEDIVAVQENNEIKIKRLEGYESQQSEIFSSTSLYPSSDMYPTQAEKIINKVAREGIENYFSEENELYPSSFLQAGTNIYPLTSKYKYLILKYKIWQDVWNDNEYTTIDTGLYYHQAIELNKHGLMNIKIKYERS